MKSIEEIKPCPFCGGEAELITRGNAFTKKRSAEIECSKCHTLQVTGAIHSSLEWCQEKAIEKWNKRTFEQQLIALGKELLKHQEEMLLYNSLRSSAVPVSEIIKAFDAVGIDLSEKIDF